MHFPEVPSKRVAFIPKPELIQGGQMHGVQCTVDVWAVLIVYNAENNSPSDSIPSDTVLHPQAASPPLQTAQGVFPYFLN